MCRRGIEKLFLKCWQPAKIDEKENNISLFFALHGSQEKIVIEQILIVKFRWMPLKPLAIFNIGLNDVIFIIDYFSKYDLTNFLHEVSFFFFFFAKKTHEIHSIVRNF